MGYYLLTASLVPILISLGGESLHWPIAVLASPLLISAAQDGMQIRFRRWGHGQHDDITVLTLRFAPDAAHVT
jgi:hypothetical protein